MKRVWLVVSNVLGVVTAKRAGWFNGTPARTVVPSYKEKEYGQEYIKFSKQHICNLYDIMFINP